MVKSIMLLSIVGGGEVWYIGGMKRLLLGLMMVVLVGVVVPRGEVVAAPCDMYPTGSEEYAQCMIRNSGTQEANCGGSFLGFRPWYAGLTDGSCEVKGPKNEGEITSFVWKIITNILYDLFILAGYLAVGFIIFGGIKLVMSQGDATRTAAARKTITFAVVGLIVAILAYAIVGFVIDNVGRGGSGSQDSSQGAEDEDGDGIPDGRPIEVDSVDDL